MTPILSADAFLFMYFFHLFYCSLGGHRPHFDYLQVSVASFELIVNALVAYCQRLKVSMTLTQQVFMRNFVAFWMFTQNWFFCEALRIAKLMTYPIGAKQKLIERI